MIIKFIIIKMYDNKTFVSMLPYDLIVTILCIIVSNNIKIYE